MDLERVSCLEIPKWWGFQPGDPDMKVRHHRRPYELARRLSRGPCVWTPKESNISKHLYTLQLTNMEVKI